MKTPLPVFLALALLLPAAQLRAWTLDSVQPRVVEVFYAPETSFVFERLDSIGTPSGWEQAPEIQNVIAACLPGHVHDIKSFFTWKGANLAGDDFVWFHRESSLIIIRATPNDVDFAKQLVKTTAVWPGNINLAAFISIGTDADGSDPEAAQLRFRVAGKSGQTIKSSASGASGVGYDCTIEPVIGADGDSFDCSTDVKVTYEGHDYTAKSRATYHPGKTQTLKLGDTPEGKPVWLHLTPGRNIEPTPIDTPEKKAALLAQIEKALAAPMPPVAGRAEDSMPAPHTIQLIYNPLGDTFPIPTGTSETTRLPSIPNRIAASLPGKMLDLKRYFENAGVEFTDPGDFAWLNPESDLVIFRAGENVPFLLAQIIEANASVMPVHLKLAASVSAGTDADGKNPGADLLRSNLTTKNGQRAVISAAGGNGSNYSLEFEPVINADDKTADANLAFKTACLGRDYAVTTRLSLAIGKPETLILGTTADGRDIYLHLTLVAGRVYTGPLVKDRSKDPALLKQIEKALAESK